MKGVTCKYPLDRPSVVYRSLLPENPSEQVASALARRSLVLPVSRSPRQEPTEENPPQSLSCSQYPFFLAEDYWQVVHIPAAPRDADFDKTELFYLIRQTHSWLRDWVTRGHNPFIHAQLYRRQLPECIQDAYTAVCTYVHKTPATSSTALRIVSSRAAQIIQTHQADASLDPSFSVVILDTFGHLARTQALLVYQFIRLYDGDIQARARAEEDMDTLDDWARQMWESAQLDVATVNARPQDLDGDAIGASDLNAFRVDHTPSSLWRAWILAESVHRTYLLAIYVHQIYLTLKHGWSGCPGTVPFTMQMGLWDSPSGYSWYEACKASSHKLFTSFLHSKDLFARAGPEDIDEFAVTALIATHGLDKIERWAGDKGGSFVIEMPREEQRRE